ncbi:DUF397 domain-containing protein [Streptomyces sp. NPDC088554]|uniref:DUF397 domain-containing protein n=1 Tax=Streptomyces sp. NPDC088554 TaxID=3365865 RepID=UPI0038126D6F
MLASELDNVIWRKSSYSGGGSGGGDCIEIADRTEVRVIRDSKNPHRAVLVFPADNWSSFIGAVKRGTLFE